MSDIKKYDILSSPSGNIPEPRGTAEGEQVGELGTPRTLGKVCQPDIVPLSLVPPQDH